MKKVVSKFFWPTIEVIIVGLFIVYILPKNKDEKLIFTVDNNDSIKMVDTSAGFFVTSELLNEEVEEPIIDNIIEEKKEENIQVIEETKKEEKLIEEEKKEEVIVPVEKETNNFNDYPVIDTYTDMVMTAYGHDCRGCVTGVTASGHDVTNTIYYEDSTFGTVRIVAADKSIPLYSIIRLSNIKGFEPIIAVVLDRGGGIGFDKSIQFDLLVESEAVAGATVGKKSNITCEVLRRGN